MSSFRETLQGPAGKVIAAGFLVAGGVAVYLTVFGGGPSIGDSASRRTFVDAESGKSFQVTVSAGMTTPVESPFSGKKTGIEPELCYWTADGHPKPDPDYVLLNRLHLPPIAGPTFCPVCHRLVIGRNPRAQEGDKPPPTEAEYKARSG
jgi:hypothetical protein